MKRYSRKSVDKKKFFLPCHLTRKGSKAYLSSSERYLTLHIIRHRP